MFVQKAMERFAEGSDSLSRINSAAASVA